MATPRFDKTRDHGTITPPWHGALYHQDGAYFAHDGEFLFTDADQPGVAKTAGASAPAKQAANPTQEAGDANSEAEGATTPATTMKPPRTPPAPVDLAAWAKGETKYPFFAVKKAFAEALPEAKASTADEIRAALNEAGMI